MSKPAAVLEAPVVRLVPVDLIDTSPSNPRKVFTGIEELAESIKTKGVLQNLLVRPKGERFELVFGERRLRAAKLVKLAQLPALVRDVGDEEVVELQLVENAKRQDIHPLEEADSYAALHEKYKRSVEEIAAKVGKSRSAVYQRLALRKLVPAARDAFLAGHLSASVAMVIAGLAQDLQAKAVKEVAGDGKVRDATPYRQALDHLQRNYMLRLKEAPFDTTDAKLVAKAGPCTTCPKRTGNQRELFGDIESPDVCTDPGCYGEKRDALWKLQVVKAKEAGQKVLPDAEAKKLLKYGRLEYNAPFVDLSETDYRGKSNRESLPKKDAPTPVLARDPDGKVHELLPRATFNKLTGRKERSAPEFDPKRHAELQAKRQREQKQMEKVESAVTEKLVAAAEKGATTAAFWRLLARAVSAEPYMISATLRRRGVAHNRFARRLEKLHDRQLRGLVLEFVLELASDGQYGDGPTGAVMDACKTLGVDYVKVANQVLDTTVAQSCPTCHLVVAVKNGTFEKHEDREGKACKSGGQPIQRIGSGAAPAAAILCAIPGCGQPGKRTKGAPGLWCADHGKKLSAVEKKSIVERNKRLAAGKKK